MTVDHADAGMTDLGLASRLYIVLSLSKRKYSASPVSTLGDMKRWSPPTGGKSALLLLLLLAVDLLLATGI